MIHNAGQLIDYVKAAAAEHGATPHTEIRVQVGMFGPVYRLESLNGVDDQRGFSLLLRLNPVPESGG